LPWGNDGGETIVLTKPNGVTSLCLPRLGKVQHKLGYCSMTMHASIGPGTTKYMRFSIFLSCIDHHRSDGDGDRDDWT